MSRGLHPAWRVLGSAWLGSRAWGESARRTSIGAFRPQPGPSPAPPRPASLPAVCDSISFCARSVPKKLSCTLRPGCLCPSNAIGLAGSVRSGQRCAQSLWAGGESARGQRQSQPQRHGERTLPASVGPSHSPVPVSSSGPGSPAAPGDTGSCWGHVRGRGEVTVSYVGRRMPSLSDTSSPAGFSF